MLSDPLIQGLHFLKENGLVIIGDQPLLRVLEKLYAFSKNSLNIGWPAHPKIFRKTPTTMTANSLHAFRRGRDP